MSSEAKPNHTQRTIVIGDVHGCLEELHDLLAAVGATEYDQLICVGDLVGKGPQSLAVLRWAMNRPNLRCVLGNHEDRILRAWKDGKIPEEKPSDLETYKQLGTSYDECLEFIGKWPLFLNERDFLVVHAGIDPTISNLQHQSAASLLTLRNLPDSDTPWYEEYREDKLILFGHWSKPEPLIRPNAIGLDTGCVYGGFLTAIILPEMRMVSVPARRAYKEKKGWPLKNSGNNMEFV